MGRFVKEEKLGFLSLQCEERTFLQLKTAGSPLAQKILVLLSQRPHYSRELAKILKVNEQKIYYHIRRLEKAGLIRMEYREEIGGVVAKYYALTAPSFVALLGNMKPTSHIANMRLEEAEFLEPFIKDGKADFLIVIGSPEAHGPRMARAKDGGYAIDLTLFLGTFLDERPQPVVKFDTEFKEEDWRRNLIIIGGPIVNTVAERVNAKFPIRFKEDGKTVSSSLTRRSYDSDQIGVIVKMPNPFSKGKSILFIAGRRGSGTRASILSFLKSFQELIITTITQRDNSLARVVEGLDMDSDGIVDAVKFLE